MLIAQTIVTTTTTLAPPIIIEAQTDWLAITVAAVAVIVSASVGVYTILQGRVIRNIETREHEWEQQDRISAHIQVTRESYQESATIKPETSFVNIWYIRLTNTGRTTATDIKWTADAVGDYEHDNNEHAADEVLWNPELKGLKDLHPGEHFNVYLEKRSKSDTFRFTISWTDQRGTHETTRLMNWN